MPSVLNAHTPAAHMVQALLLKMKCVNLMFRTASSALLILHLLYQDSVEQPTSFITLVLPDRLSSDELIACRMRLLS